MIAVKLILGVALGVLAVSVCFKLAATRSRNARLTEIPNTERFRWSATVQTADHPSILPAIIWHQFVPEVQWPKG